MLALTVFMVMGAHKIQAANYTFSQSAWTGGLDGGNNASSSNLTNWTKYQSITNVSTGTSLSLATTTTSVSARADITSAISPDISDYTGGGSAVAATPQSAATRNGVTYIAYVSREYNGYINVAYRSSANWANRVDVTTASSAIIPSQTPSIAVDSAGTVHIVYYSNELNTTDTNIAYRNSTNWANKVDISTSTAANANNGYPVLAIDSSDVVHMAYQSGEYSTGVYNIAYRNSTNWANRVNVTATTTVSSGNPSIAVDSSGTVHIAYNSKEFSASYSNIAYRNSTNWSSRVDVTATTTSSALNSSIPYIAVDSSGTVHLAYASKELYSAKFNIAYRNSTNWSNRVDITTSNIRDSGNPSIAINPSGVVYVFYASREFNANIFNIAYHSSANWATRNDVTTTPGSSGSSFSPSPVIDGSGNISVVYGSYEYLSTTYNFALRSSANWATRTDVTQAKNSVAQRPAVVIDKNGVEHMVYVSQEYNGYFNIAYRNSANWANRVDITIATTSVPSQTPAITVDSSGVVHIAYQSYEVSSSYSNLAYRNSSNWANRVDITTSTAAFIQPTLPSLAVDSSGVVYLAYSSFEFNSSHTNIVYRNSNNWGMRTDIGASAVGNASRPSLAVDSSKVAHIAYQSNELNASYTNIAYRNSANWASRVDISTSTTVSNSMPALAVDSSGVVHIAYNSLELNPSSFYIAYRNSTNWGSRTDIANTLFSSISSAPALAVDSSGVVHIAYFSYDVKNFYTNIAYRNSSNWTNRIDVTTNTNTTLGSNAIASDDISMALDSSGLPYIAYYSYENNLSQNNIALKNLQLSGYYTSGNAVSSAYDTGDATASMGGISWDENPSLPSGTGVTVSLRTAATSGALSSATWADFTNATANCVKAASTTTCSAAAIPSAMKDGSGDRWIQYKAALTAPRTATPVVTSVRFTYNINAQPKFNSAFGVNGVSVVQNATSTDPNFAKVQIQYSVEDPDTNTGSTTPGYITPSFEYNTGSGWQAITSSFLGATDLNNKAVATSTYNTYSAVWNAPAQLSGIYSTTTQVRVTANDNELANNIVQAASSSFTLDAKGPTGSLTLDVSAGTISYSSADNNVLQYRVSNNADGSADSLNALSNGWTATNATSTSAVSAWSFTNLAASPAVYLVSKDFFGNQSTITAVAPSTLTHFTVADLTSSGSGQYREIISWQTYVDSPGAAFSQYQIYRSTDNVNFGLLAAINDVNTSYYIDPAVTFGVNYYYKVRVTDRDGDISTFSSTVGIKAGVVSDVTAPLISIIASSTAASTATVTWQTDEPSTAQVAYGLTGNYSAYSMLTATLATSASVSLLNLNPLSTYHFQIIAKDAASNTATSSDLTFTTTAAADVQAPTVPTGLTAVSASATAVTLTWVPSNDNVAVAGYRIFRNGSAVASTTLAAFTDAALTASTVYTYTTSAFDAAGNESARSATATVTTLAAADVTPPLISIIASSTAAATATITWQTNEPSTAQVAFGLTGNYSAYSPVNSALATSASVSLLNLNPLTSYHFQAIAKDAAGNTATSSDLTFTTTAAADVQAPTVPTGLTATSTFATQVALAWVPSNDNVGVSGYHIFRNGSVVATTTLATYTDSGLAASTAYSYAVSAFDAAGNESAQSISASAQTLAAVDIIPPNILSVASSTSAATAAITWTTDKPASSQVNYGLSAAYTAASILDANFATTHSVSLADLLPKTTYHFQIVSVSSSGFAATSSDYTFVTAAAADTQAPAAPGDLTASSTSATAIALTWVPSSDNVGVAGYNIYRDGNAVASTTLAVFNDTGLTASTTYAYEVSAFDAAGNESARSATASATTLVMPDVNPPVITNILADDISTTQARIVWTTDKLSSSLVEYSVSPDAGFSSSSLDSDFVTYHTVVLKNLLPNTAYLYRVTSTNQAGNGAADDNTAAGYSFTTLDGPQITGVSVSADDTAEVTWSTDRAADSFVYFSLFQSFASSTSFGSSDLSATTTESPDLFPHRVVLANLSPGAEYYFYVKSTAANGASSVDDNRGNYYTFITTDTVPPVISSVGSPVVSSSAGVIVWDTNKPATSQVAYGTASSSLVNTTDINNTLSIGHAVTLVNLASSTTYYYNVISQNKSGYASTSPVYSFTSASDTQTIQYIIIGGGGSAAPSQPQDVTPPVISNVAASSVTSFDAIVTFDTDKPAVGIVEYGTDDNYGYSNAIDSFDTSHSIKLSGLRMGTEYHFRVKAMDKSGNKAAGQDQSFTTEFLTDDVSSIKVDNLYQYQQELENQLQSIVPSLVPPFIGKTQATNLTEDSATIAWQTNIKSYSVVEYAPDGSYNASNADKPYAWESSDVVSKTLDHQIVLGNLQSNTLYHFRVKSFSLPQVIGKSADLEFTTKAAKVDARVVDTKNSSFRVVWTTDEPASSVVEYRNQKKGDTYQKVDETLKTFHDMTVENLPSGTLFEIQVSGKNAKGNDILGKSVLKTQTSEDVTPPVITNLKIDNALVPGNTNLAQTVVSWTTDEPASSVVYYQEGSAQASQGQHLANKVENTDGFTKDHKVILSSLKQGAIYGIQIESQDQSGNVNLFPVRTIVIPQQSESVTDIIFKNFADAFSFLQSGNK